MKKENKVILILLCITIIIAIIFLLLNMTTNQENSDTTNYQNNNLKENKLNDYVGKDLTQGTLTINDADIKLLYSYVYPAHFFLTVDQNGNLSGLSEGLFSNRLVRVSDLSYNYRMSMVYSVLKDYETITKDDFAYANMRIFGDINIPDSFFCYDESNIGTIEYSVGQYRFQGKNYSAGEIFEKGYTLVNVKRGNDTIELYEAEYSWDSNEVNNALESPSKYDFYGKNGTIVFSLSIKEIEKGQEYIDQKVIENADAFKQNKITFTFFPYSGYYLTSAEPVA